MNLEILRMAVDDKNEFDRVVAKSVFVIGEQPIELIEDIWSVMNL